MPETPDPPTPGGEGGGCGSIHPVELEWHCECRQPPHHPGRHRCYGCGFEWDQGDPHSRMPNETDQTLTDLLGFDEEAEVAFQADMRELERRERRV